MNMKKRAHKTITDTTMQPIQVGGSSHKDGAGGVVGTATSVTMGVGQGTKKGGGAKRGGGKKTGGRKAY